MDEELGPSDQRARDAPRRSRRRHHVVRQDRRRARRARVRDRRLRLQGGLARRPGGARHQVEQPALGGGVEVSAAPAHDAHHRDRGAGRTHRRAHAGGVARTDPARRSDGRQRQPAQPGRDRPQGHPRRRLGAGRAGRRRHPARGAGDRRQAHRTREEVPLARSLSGVRQRGGQAGGRGDHALRQHLVPGAGQGAHPPLRQPRRHGHRRPRRQAGRPAGGARAGARRRRPLRPDGRDAGRARTARREERAEPGRRDRRRASAK